MELLTGLPGMLLAFSVASLSLLQDNKAINQELSVFISILGWTASSPSEAPGLSAEDQPGRTTGQGFGSQFRPEPDPRGSTELREDEPACAMTPTCVLLSGPPVWPTSVLGQKP